MNVKTTLPQRTADALYEQIMVQKKYALGEKLPNENELAAQFGVSRATLREAVRMLCMQGVLSVTHGLGTFVSLDAKGFRDMQFGELGKLRMQLTDVFELRRVIEIEAAAMACERATDEEIAEILRCGAVVEGCIQVRANRTPADAAFHRAIAVGSHNEFMIHLIPMIYAAVSETLVSLGTDELFAKSTLSDHALIMEALQEHDAQLARNAMAIHMSHATKFLREGGKLGEIVNA